MQLNQGSYHCVLHIRYWNFHRMPNYVQLNTKWMQLCAQIYFSNGISIWWLFLWHSVLYFLSWVFFQLEAKETQLPDDLKQCNRSYISMSNAMCIKTDISKIHIFRLCAPVNVQTLMTLSQQCRPYIYVLVLTRDFLDEISKYLMLWTSCPLFPGVDFAHCSIKQFLLSTVQGYQN
jgi:hypothetical protein